GITTTCGRTKPATRSRRSRSSARSPTTNRRNPRTETEPNNVNGSASGGVPGKGIDQTLPCTPPARTSPSEGSPTTQRSHQGDGTTTHTRLPGEADGTVPPAISWTGRVRVEREPFRDRRPDGNGWPITRA